MGRRRWVVLAVAAGVAFAVAFFVGSAGDDDPDDAGSELALDDLEALSAEARALVARVEQGAGVRHHAVYEQSGGHRFEVWTDGARVREETSPRGSDRRLLLRTAGDTLACTDEAGEWSCEEPTETVPGLQGRLDQLVADLIGADVTVSDATSADLDVQCFDVSGGEDAVVEICLTPQGVLARLAAGGDQLELVTLDDDVDDDDFDRPD